VNSRRGLKWFLNRHSRWYKIRRRLAFPAFIAEPMANLATVGLVWAFSGATDAAWGGLVLLVGLGILRDAIQTRRLRGSYPRLKHLIFSPVKDFLLLPVWLDAVLNSRVQWRGHRFLVGRMTRLRRARVPRRVRRRVSRVRKIRDQNASQRDQPEE
jgi:ceramide glucosyltransferase